MLHAATLRTLFLSLLRPQSTASDYCWTQSGLDPDQVPASVALPPPQIIYTYKNTMLLTERLGLKKIVWYWSSMTKQTFPLYMWGTVMKVGDGSNFPDLARVVT